MKFILPISIFFLSINISLGQNDGVRMFIFGHSLIHHEFQLNPTPSQETSVPHWLHFLSDASNKSYQVSGQYGFLPQHAILPPFAQWGFDFVEAAWDSDYQTFAEANFTDILITPGNFIQWQAPSENYPYENLSPVSASNDIISWCADQEQDLRFYIYENWPDMAGFLNSGFPPNQEEWAAYNEYLQSDFIAWFDEYYETLKSENVEQCVKLIPVGRLISELLQLDPFRQIPITELYEDDAPHGRANIYFLASLITYMAIYEEQPEASYMPDEIINPIIRDNFEAISSFFWTSLATFNDVNNESKVFCDLMVSVNENIGDQANYKFSPNPSQGIFYFQSANVELSIDVINATGQILETLNFEKSDSEIDLTKFPDGLYFLKIYEKGGAKVNSLRVIKNTL